MLGPYYVTTDARRREAWGTPCDTSKFTHVDIDGRSLLVNSLAKLSFTAWDLIRAEYEYELTGNDTGFYSCRHMRHNPNMPMTSHAWAMSLDVNWLENPAGSKLITDIPFEMIRELEALQTNSGAWVFRWGGDWDRDPSTGHSYYDAMHWECIAHPLDLATGINIQGLPERQDDMYASVKYRDGFGIAEGNPHVKEWQLLLGFTGDDVDGKYGDQTKAAVAAATNTGGMSIGPVEGAAILGRFGSGASVHTHTYTIGYTGETETQ